MKDQQLRLNINLSNTTPIKSQDGNEIFAEGVILRKISRFVAGTEEDAVVPIPVFYDIKTGNILVETLPKELRKEYESGD